jgi:hypothetical protein
MATKSFKEMKEKRFRTIIDHTVRSYEAKKGLSDGFVLWIDYIYMNDLVRISK